MNRDYLTSLFDSESTGNAKAWGGREREDDQLFWPISDGGKKKERHERRRKRMHDYIKYIRWY